jgi:hypothetical protein
VVGGASPARPTTGRFRSPAPRFGFGARAAVRRAHAPSADSPRARRSPEVAPIDPNPACDGVISGVPWRQTPHDREELAMGGAEAARRRAGLSRLRRRARSGRPVATGQNLRDARAGRVPSPPRGNARASRPVQSSRRGSSSSRSRTSPGTEIDESRAGIAILAAALIDLGAAASADPKGERPGGAAALRRRWVAGDAACSRRLRRLPSSRATPALVVPSDDVPQHSDGLLAVLVIVVALVIASQHRLAVRHSRLGWRGSRAIRSSS